MKYSYSIETDKKEPQSQTLEYIAQDHYFDSKDSYTYTYTYKYPWVNTEESIIDSCQFNEQDELLLTSKKLRVAQKYSTKVVNIYQLKKLSVVFRRLMLPITTGGIFAPFAVVAMITGVLEPVAGLSIFIISGMIFYYGYRGAYQLKIEMESNTVSVFVDDYTKDLRHFVSRANRYLLKSNYGEVF